jgi:fructose-1,6-bisphosphatase/inositol monophosphatase family enzyme
MGAFEQLQAAAYITRTWGDCYGYLLVATGRAEAMVDAIMNVWDAAAVQPIIEEAGGMFTDWQGQPTIHSAEAIASNGLIHAELLAITRALAPRVTAP